MASRKPDDSRGMRLDAYLARAGLASRKEARGLIRRGGVRVDGEICRDAQRRITSEGVSLGDQTVDSPALQTDFLLHKPTGRTSWLPSDKPRRRVSQQGCTSMPATA